MRQIDSAAVWVCPVKRRMLKPGNEIFAEQWDPIPPASRETRSMSEIAIYRKVLPKLQFSA